MSAVTNPSLTDPIPGVPTLYGTPFEGGFYAGRYIRDGNLFAMVNAPKLLGEIRAVLHPDWHTPIPGARSVIDGRANTIAMAEAGSPLAQQILALTINGLNDWCIPARDQLELNFRNGKPGTYENWTYPSRLKYWGVTPGVYNGVDESGNGYNAHSVPPGAAYTETSPAQTIAEAFREGGPEVFVEGWYTSSTEFLPAGVWGQDFDDGGQVVVGKYYGLRARAVREVLISASPIPLAA